jgi:F0F1-type ATP synthase assembly protein I
MVQGGQQYDLAANVLVGVALGWGAQKLWPGLKPWGYAVGIVLGTVSGFYQMFKAQQRNAKPKKQG